MKQEKKEKSTLTYGKPEFYTVNFTTHHNWNGLIALLIENGWDVGDFMVWKNRDLMDLIKSAQFRKNKK